MNKKEMFKKPKMSSNNAEMMGGWGNMKSNWLHFNGGCKNIPYTISWG
jgi:hypothetical protein